MPGQGLIETIRVRDGRFPFLQRHLARLARSIEALGLPPLTRDPEPMVRPFAGVGDGVVRLEVQRGQPIVTVRELPPDAPPRVIGATRVHSPYPHKTTERDAFDAALHEARAAGADDALLLTSDGFVAEGTVWAVCWWEGERLRAPALDLGILPGVGRARVGELVALEEGRFQLADLEARSLVLVNAVRGVVPIASLDGQEVPPDQRTAALSRRFWPD